jgi:hypothetical protein
MPRRVVAIAPKASRLHKITARFFNLGEESSRDKRQLDASRLFSIFDKVIIGFQKKVCRLISKTKDNAKIAVVKTLTFMRYNLE